jgi:hypothetical protein
MRVYFYLKHLKLKVVCIFLVSAILFCGCGKKEVISLVQETEVPYHINIEGRRGEIYRQGVFVVTWAATVLAPFLVFCVREYIDEHKKAGKMRAN